MSQKDFAKGICISPSFLADIENDHRKANDRLIKLISMTYGISERWIVNGEGEIFYKSPDEKTTRLVNIFNQLPTDYQDYALEQLDKLLKLRKKQK